MTQTVSSTVAQRDSQPTGNAVIERYRNVFAEVLPSHIKPATWVRVAQGALRRDEKLAAAAARNPESLVAALLDAARRGLEPGTEQYYLVAYGNEVQGIPGYQGEVELIYRAGAVSSVIVEVVHQRDQFAYQPGMHDRPIHEIDWDAEDRGPLRLVYAYGVMKDGATSRVVVMNRAEVMKHKAMSRGSDRPDSPWNKWEKSMWLKTGAHELAKWVPTSAEYLRDQARAAGEMIRTANTPTSAPPAAGQPGGTERTQEPVRATVIVGQTVDPPAGDAERQPTDLGNAPALLSDQQRKAMFAQFNRLGYAGDGNRQQRLDIAQKVLGLAEPVESTSDLTEDEADRLIAELKQRKPAQPATNGGGAR